MSCSHSETPRHIYGTPWVENMYQLVLKLLKFLSTKIIHLKNDIKRGIWKTNRQIKFITISIFWILIIFNNISKQYRITYYFGCGQNWTFRHSYQTVKIDGNGSNHTMVVANVTIGNMLIPVILHDNIYVHNR